MRVVVCLKHVPDPVEPPRFDPQSHSRIREGVPGTINPMDDHALELALRWKQAHGCEVVVLALGPQSARDSLLKALAKGADRAVWILDPALAQSDAVAVSSVLASAVRKLSPVDLVLTGMAGSDAGTGHTGPALGERLGLAVLTHAHAAEWLPPDTLRIQRAFEATREVLEVKVPALVAVKAVDGEPRLPSFKGIMTAHAKEFQLWNLADLEMSGEEVGPESWTRTLSAQPHRPALPTFLEGSPEDAARELATFLQAEGLIS